MTKSTPNDPLLQHIIALPLNLVLEELWVTVGSHRHRWGARDEVDAVVMTSDMRQTMWLLEDVRNNSSNTARGSARTRAATALLPDPSVQL